MGVRQTVISPRLPSNLRFSCGRRSDVSVNLLPIDLLPYDFLRYHSEILGEGYRPVEIVGFRSPLFSTTRTKEGVGYEGSAPACEGFPFLPLREERRTHVVEEPNIGPPQVPHQFPSLGSLQLLTRLDLQQNPRLHVLDRSQHLSASVVDEDSTCSLLDELRRISFGRGVEEGCLSWYRKGWVVDGS